MSQGLNLRIFFLLLRWRWFFSLSKNNRWSFLNCIFCATLIQEKIITYISSLLCKRILLISLVLQSQIFINRKSEMVFCYQNCSDLLWEKMVLKPQQNRKKKTIFLAGISFHFRSFVFRYGFSDQEKIRGWRTRICKKF